MKIIYRLPRKALSLLSLKQKFILKNVVSFFGITNLGSVFYSKPNKRMLKEFFELLEPKSTTLPLARYGNEGDGGYLIPKEIVHWDGIVSPGVGDSTAFEKSIAGTATKVILVDGTVNAPENLPANFEFVQKMLCAKRRNNSETDLEEILRDNNLNSKRNLLQIDIEGAEWDILQELDELIIDEFRIIVIELHDLHNLVNQKMLIRRILVLEKLLKYFFPTHLHLNNAGGFFHFNRRRYPKVIELTFLSKRYYEEKESSVTPNLFDNASDPMIFNWHKFG